jgi:hypothetical protein
MLVVCLLLSSFLLKAQTGSDFKVRISEKVANKMKDTLGLSVFQRDSVYATNLLLHDKKSALWQQYAAGSDSLRLHLQKIENARDSLYQRILNRSQFILYRHKKAQLISND